MKPVARLARQAVGDVWHREFAANPSFTKAETGAQSKRQPLLPGFLPLWPGTVAPRHLAVAIEHVLPSIINAKLGFRLDSKVPDQQLDDVLKEHVAGRKMKSVDIDRSNLLSVWSGKKDTGSARGMHVGKGDVAHTLRMPVIEKKFPAFKIEDFIEVACGSDAVRSPAIVFGNMDDGVLMGNIEQEIRSPAVLGSKLEPTVEARLVRLHRNRVRKVELISITENVGFTNAGNRSAESLNEGIERLPGTISGQRV